MSMSPSPIDARAEIPGRRGLPRARRSTGGVPRRRSCAGPSAWFRAGTSAARSTDASSSRRCGPVARSPRRRPAQALPPRGHPHRSRCRSGRRPPAPPSATCRPRARTEAEGTRSCSARSRRATSRPEAGSSRSPRRETCRCSDARRRRRNREGSPLSSARAGSPDRRSPTRAYPRSSAAPPSPPGLRPRSPGRTGPNRTPGRLDRSASWVGCSRLRRALPI